MSLSIELLDVDEFSINENRLTAIETAVQPKKRSLNDVVSAYTLMHNKIHLLYQAQAELERELFGYELSDRSDKPELKKLGCTAIRILVAKAEKQFSAPGAILNISRDTILEITGQDNWEKIFYDQYRRNSNEPSSLPLDLDRLWEGLESTYGGQSGINQTYKQQVKGLVNYFHLDQEDSFKRKPGFVSIFARVWTEKKEYGIYKGEYAIASSGRDSISKAFIALKVFCEWAGFSELSEKLDVVNLNLSSYDNHFAPRDKTSLPGMDIIQFKEKVEFRLSTEIAQQLMLFVGEFYEE